MVDIDDPGPRRRGERRERQQDEAAQQEPPPAGGGGPGAGLGVIRHESKRITCPD